MMKKLLKNPLFYKEWIGCRWVALIITLSLILIKYISIMNKLGRYKARLVLHPEFVIYPYWFNNEFLREPQTIVFIFPLILVLVVLLFKSEKQTATCGLISSMPFKRKDIILSKYIMGIFSIFIAFFINFLIISIFYVVNVEFIKTSYIDIPMWYLINFLYCVLFFTFSVFVQTVMGKYLVAIFFTPIFFVMPSVIFMYLFCIVDWIFPVYSSANGKLICSMGQKLYGLISPFNIYSVVEPNRENISSKVYKAIYSNYGFKIVYIAGIIGLFLWLSVYCYKKIDMEKIHYIVLFKKFQVVFNLLISVNIAVAFDFFLLNVLNLNGSYISLTIFWLMSLVSSYILCNKIIKFASR